ncbi:hypothetical protein Tsp_08396 [Trichinella spiralis]|uniref:hypothetical protein n=1 Tax=Trichinella spiralis TaxID=6334 RepID=UPI0001EFB562|nr:hypothetical protein Tsp_08396 [Trichinella spiralis]
MASLLQVALLFWLYKAQLTNCDYQAKSSNIGFACQLSSECGGQALCANKHCMPAAPTNRQCDTVKECRTNENCRYGICWKTHHVNAILTCQNVAKYLGPTTCKKHHDCPGQSICINEKCIVAQPTETECDTDLQCLRNEACKQGICWKEYKGMHRRVIIYPDIKKCTKHTECKNQSLCVYGKCKQAYPTDRRCQNDRECHRSEGCMHGICWRVDNVVSFLKSQRAERTKLALISISVMTAFVALEVQPIEYATVIKTANTMKDASMAFVGIFRSQCSCYFSRALSGERCYKDAECGKLELCVSDYCRIAIPTHRDCASSNQCRREEKCRFDMCWKLYNKGVCVCVCVSNSGEKMFSSDFSILEEDILEKYCKRHAECKDQFICYRGKCQIAAPTNQNCESDNNCPPKQVCKHGICWTLAHGKVALV